MILALAGLLALGSALAEEPPAPVDPGRGGTVLRLDGPPVQWSGLGIPLVSVNSTDGVGFGAGGEVFARDRGELYGYRVKITLSTYLTTTLGYQSHWLQAYVSGDVDWLVRATFQGWRNHWYAGVGGADLATDWGDRERFNHVLTPGMVVAVIKRFPNTPWGVYGEGYARYVTTDPARGGLLDERAPFGVDGGTYFDVTVGGLYDQKDRWPVPTKGLSVELDLRAGGTFTDEAPAPLFGMHGEVIGWVPLVGDRLVLGGRFLGEKTFGKRPFFEQNLLGGLWRDELGFEQVLTGYARLRARGDGLLSTMIELRSKLVQSHHPVFDVGLYLSAFAEETFLFDGNVLGPHLPSLGGGPQLIWQGAIQFRPFVSVGWIAPEPGAKRQPALQYGVSFMDTL